MCTHNIQFHGEIRKILALFIEKLLYQEICLRLFRVNMIHTVGIDNCSSCIQV